LEEPRVYKLYLQPGMKLVLGLVFIAFGGIGAAIALSPSLFQGSKGAPPPLVGVLLLAILGLYLGLILCLPYRITLAEDGTVEFISVLRRRTFRAEEIKSIKPAGSQFGFLLVRTDRGKIRLLAQFDGFHDFLTRLEALRPGVELRGC
jgi:hypothetical protein